MRNGSQEGLLAPNKCSQSRGRAAAATITVTMTGDDLYPDALLIARPSFRPTVVRSHKAQRGASRVATHGDRV
jgi:hypothetical protein